MTNKLSMEEFVPFAPEQPGSVWMHHCKQGLRKNKLFITRNQDGTIIAFCHHCNSSGFHGVHDYKNSISNKASGANSHVRGVQGKRGLQFSLPADCEGQPSQWGREALAWAEQYLTTQQIADSPLTYSATEGAIVFPMVNADYPHTLVGFQLRRFPESDPKYSTNKNNSLGVDIPMDPLYTVPSKTVVVTEDWVSAYKAALAGYEAIPLLGSNMRESQFMHILTHKYSRYVIALDNDNPLIRRQQRHLDTRFSAYGNTLLLKLTKDLKEFSLADIKDLIE